MADITRRDFVHQVPAALGGVGLAAAAAGEPLAAQTAEKFARPTHDAISLAMYSLNRSFTAGVWDLLDIARIVREDFNFDGMEYVTIYFKDVREQSMLRHLNQRANDYAAMARAMGLERVFAFDSVEAIDAGLDAAVAANAPGHTFVVLEVDPFTADEQKLEQPPFDGPEMKYRFGRAFERATGAEIFGYRL